MDYTFTLIVEEGEDGYYISDVVELPGCHSQGKTIDELLTRTKEAIELYLEVMDEEEYRPRFIGVQRIKIEG